MGEKVDLSMCFVCGEKNPRGLKVKKQFNEETKRAHIELFAEETLQGYPNMIHGGILAALADETMSYAVEKCAPTAVTATETVDFKAPALVGMTLVCEAWVTNIEGRKHFCAAEIRDKETDKLLITATSLFIVVNLEKINK